MLVVSYEGGQLAPLLVAGMSRRKLANWEGFSGIWNGSRIPTRTRALHHRAAAGTRPADTCRFGLQEPRQLSGTATPRRNSGTGSPKPCNARTLITRKSQNRLARWPGSIGRSPYRPITILSSFAHAASSLRPGWIPWSRAVPPWIALYRRTANTAVPFRLCFGEVFLSRWFLFLGSSLSEDYFWNLFGETLERCGANFAPRFA